jgi:hypothetical protein
MSRQISILMLLVLCAFMAACGLEGNDPAAPDAGKRIEFRIVEPDSHIGDPGEISDPVEPEEENPLALLLEISERTRYYTIKGVVDPQVGGVVKGTVDDPRGGWRPEQEFSVVFPPRAIPGTEPVVISILVPMEGSEGPVFQLLPDMQFNVPVTVTLQWPTWIQHGMAFTTLFCLNRTAADGPFSEPVFYQSDLWVLDFEDGDARTPPGQVQFQTEHFSRWAIDKGKPN